MSLSANSVIHFTDTKENLQSILTIGFKVNYCYENIIVKGGKIYGYVPMVCFCDIPLSKIKNHIDSYGHYGIGLKKEWAIEKRLNPVLYIECNSSLGENLRSALKHYMTTIGNKGRFETDEQRKLMEVARYIKNYRHDLIRKNGSKEKDYKFYDEKEWRYVPNSMDNDTLFPLMFTDAAILEEKNESAQKIKLQFDPNDISYIVLNDDSEISGFISFIKETFKSPLKDVDTLITRIITINQINYDF